MPDSVTGVDLENVQVSSGPSSVNVYTTQQDRRPLDQRVEELEQMVYGEPRWNEPGLIRRHQSQLRISRVSLGFNIAQFALMAGYLIYQWIK